MLRYIAIRVVRMFLSLIVISMLTFALLEAAPGSFADIQRLTTGASALTNDMAVEVASQMTARYGDEIPAWKRYLIFMKGALVWDFGPSYKYPQMTIQEIIATAFPISATLAVMSVALSLLVALPLGILAAVRQNSWLDYFTMFLATLGHSLPNYLVGVGLMLLFSKYLGLLPTSGWTEPKHVIMPLLALSIGSVAGISRYIRSSLLDNLRKLYVTTVRAKGGGFRAVVFGHALRNSLIPLITVLGPMLARLMTGTLFIEALFGIPGLGLYFADAARSRDMPLLMGATMFFALILMTMNLLVDLAYGFLDPRIRFVGRSST